MKGVLFNQRGFTLVEIMMVVIIIGILAVLAIPRYQKYTLESKLSEVHIAVGEIKTGMEKYYNSHANKYTSMPGVTGNDHVERYLRIDLGDQENFRFEIQQSINNGVEGYVVFGILTLDGKNNSYNDQDPGMQVVYTFPRGLVANYTTDEDWAKGWNDSSFFQ